MERHVYKTVDDYLKAVPAKERAVLKKLRATIRKAAPKAEEVISYRIPGYKYHGHLIFFALQKDFCSLYGTSRALLKKFQKELKDFEVSGTSIHFTADHPLPLSLVTKIVKERVRMNEARMANKTNKGKKKPAKRERHTMPISIKNALTQKGVMNAYKSRPPYQRNDYVGWIVGAKLPATKQKRIDQMIAELKAGNKYMNMKYNGG